MNGEQDSDLEDILVILTPQELEELIEYAIQLKELEKKKGA